MDQLPLIPWRRFDALYFHLLQALLNVAIVEDSWSAVLILELVLNAVWRELRGSEAWVRETDISLSNCLHPDCSVV